MTLAWSSPHNTRVAAALLDVLAARGDAAARMRALHAAGADEETLRNPSRWITEASLRAMFRAARADRAVGRRVGEVLVTPLALGLALRIGGIGSVEKAYRRFDRIAARECQEAAYSIVELRAERATVALEPAPGSAPEEAWCGMREGMLAQLPTLFALPPAHVRETACARRGARACRFEVRWRGERTGGLWAGAAIGVALGAGLALAWGGGWLAGIAAVVAVGALGAGAGRSLDLAAELRSHELLRHARYGVRAQAERELAETIDELAKLDGVLAEARVRRETERAGWQTPAERLRAERQESREGSEELGRFVAGALGRMDEAVASLESHLGRLHRAQVRGAGAPWRDLAAWIEACVEDVRRLREGTSELARGLEPAGADLEPGPLGPAVERGVERARSELGGGLAIELHVEPGLAPVRRRPADVERMVLGLVRNATLATDGTRRVDVSLAQGPGGVELVVADDGAGLDGEIVDEVFDPFFTGLAEGPDGARPAGETGAPEPAGGLGLASVYLTVEEHGGELRVESDPSRGTRVTVLFPRAV